MKIMKLKKKKFKSDSVLLNKLYRSYNIAINDFSKMPTKENYENTVIDNKKIIDVFVANILLKLNAGDEDEIIRIAKKQKFIS